MTKRLICYLLILFANFAIANTPLTADKAFKLSVKAIDPNTIKVQWLIAPKYFLYKDCLQFINSANDDAIKIGSINYPTAQMKVNKQGQLYPVYHSKLSLNIPILSHLPGENIIEIRYQGCSDDGFCYPPERRQIKITSNNNLAVINANIEEMLPTQQASATQSLPSLDKNPNDSIDNVTRIFASKNLALIALSFLGIGILLSFTPCVLPMIPVLSGIIVGHGHKISTKKAFLLSLSYVLSMSVTYSIIGAIIALLGRNLQIIMQSPWVIAALSIVFILLALSMFDVYKIQMPQSLQNKFTSISKHQAKGHYLSAIILGSISILVLSPCVSAPLIGVLSYIAQTGDIFIGLISLFFLSLGMGIPLLLIGTSAGKLLPKAGIWMNNIKKLFGIILLGVAIYLIDRIIPSIFSMVLWASLCIFTGIYLKPFKLKNNEDKFKQGLAIMLLGYGLLILYGASFGHTNPLLPLKSYKQQKKTFKTKTVIVTTLKETLNALDHAKEEKTPAILYFYADWCASCHIMASTTLQNEEVLSELEHIEMIKIDITKNNANSRELLNHFNVIAPPTFLFFNKQGQPLSSPQLVGEVSADTLLNFLRKISDPT